MERGFAVPMGLGLLTVLACGDGQKIVEIPEPAGAKSMLLIQEEGGFKQAWAYDLPISGPLPASPDDAQQVLIFQNQTLAEMNIPCGLLGLSTRLGVLVSEVGGVQAPWPQFYSLSVGEIVRFTAADMLPQWASVLRVERRAPRCPMIREEGAGTFPDGADIQQIEPIGEGRFLVMAADYGRTYFAIASAPPGVLPSSVMIGSVPGCGRHFVVVGERIVIGGVTTWEGPTAMGLAVELDRPALMDRSRVEEVARHEIPPRYPEEPNLVCRHCVIDHVFKPPSEIGVLAIRNDGDLFAQAVDGTWALRTAREDLDYPLSCPHPRLTDRVDSAVYASFEEGVHYAHTRVDRNVPRSQVEMLLWQGLASGPQCVDSSFEYDPATRGPNFEATGTMRDADGSVVFFARADVGRPFLVERLENVWTPTIEFTEWSDNVLSGAVTHLGSEPPANRGFLLAGDGGRIGMSFLAATNCAPTIIGTEDLTRLTKIDDTHFLVADKERLRHVIVEPVVEAPGSCQ